MNSFHIGSAACAFMLSGCATTKFTSDYDRAQDFEAYQTFAWGAEAR